MWAVGYIMGPHFLLKVHFVWADQRVQQCLASSYRTVGQVVLEDNTIDTFLSIICVVLLLNTIKVGKHCHFVLYEIYST